MTGAVLVLVPARGGSKGVPGKNLRTVGGIPLVGRAVRAARHAVARLGGTGHAVVCSTDDPRIAEAARAWGAEVLDRPGELATDTADSADVALHALETLRAGGRTFEALALVQCTTPLLEGEDLAGAVRLFREGGGAPVVTVSPAHHPFWTYRLDGGRLVPLFGRDSEVPRRQDAPLCVALNGGAFVAAPEDLRRTRRFVDPGRTLGYVMPPDRGIDVDEEADLDRGEAALARRAPRTLTIGGRPIGAGAPCFVIAEGGVNHNGDPDLAHRLVDAAADARADAIKFQTFDPAALAAADAPLAEYQERSEGASTQRRMLERLVLSPQAHRDLKAHAEARGLVFLSSPFDEASADFLDALDVAAFKVPSGEVTNLPYLRHLAGKGRPLLVSTGMCDMVEVAAAVDAIRAAGDPPLALLHCVSSYPADAADSNLRAMRTLAAAFAVPAGWSDHTLGDESALAAAALGASLLERHLTLDKHLPGPDHRASLEPREFARMVAGIRAVESALGDGVKAPRPSEVPVAAAARKSLHWRRALEAGARVAADDLVALRPGTGLPPSVLPSVIGRRVTTAVRAGSPVQERELEPIR